MTQHSGNVLLKLLPITLAVFVAFLIIGMQLPVLPLHLNHTLGMSTLVVGVVVGAQFAAALLSRAWAGNFADMRGPKRALLTGLLVAASSGLLYLASLGFVDSPGVSVWILLAGRVVLALGESLIITGSMGWGMGRVGPQNAGKVMAWIGIAIYAAFALGAPLGVAINQLWGFSGIAVGTMLLPLLALGIVAGAKGVAPTSQRRTSFYTVLGAVWLPGLGLAFSSIGFGVITAFIALLFASKDWGNASFAFTAFGVAFIGARIFFGHLPDKLGGAGVALVCVLIEAAGQLLIWGAGTPLMAYTGAALTGFGYSLAFPGFGVEAIKRAPPQTRGLAMGAYVAFLDIALGISSPLAGALAGAAGVASVYLAGAVAVACSVGVAWALLARRPALSAC
ncbi:arabinose transporter [Pseudomonas tolaasii]|uniref:arabinose transporter n=1 Tax=Pseudomonas tolaasii TaxID=29442 RepID=UPI001C56954D|nr:arabinose transporter [Pseudomonas tolaasii]MBW1249241.1 arabinose transporter [Pseudomonas tolaasii]WLH49340.1 arabinose transporter [Pseudomonas tolaasii]